MIAGMSFSSACSSDSLINRWIKIPNWKQILHFAMNRVVGASEFRVCDFIFGSDVYFKSQKKLQQFQTFLKSLNEINRIG